MLEPLGLLAEIMLRESAAMNNGIDCPRCASENDDDEEFCWMCRWDFSKEFSTCDQCHNELEQGEDCFVCKEDPTAGSAVWRSENYK